jgi:hypothetical protein
LVVGLVNFFLSSFRVAFTFSPISSMAGLFSSDFPCASPTIYRSSVVDPTKTMQHDYGELESIDLLLKTCTFFSSRCTFSSEIVDLKVSDSGIKP